jgi:1-acyl-sn-glycerol-3-phosphate acyltransferase
MIQNIRSVIFNLFYACWSIFCLAAFIPSFITWKTTYLAGRLWAKGVVFGMRVIVGTKYRFEGLENIPEGGCIIACRHQSAWETIIIFILTENSGVVYKKELARIPLFGWYNVLLKNIRVDREGGIKSLQKTVKLVKERTEEGRRVVLYPEGTRTSYGTRTELKPSIYLMYKEGIDIVPAALNSGVFWPKDSYKRRSGTIVLKILPPIEKGLSKKDFMKRLQDNIYDESEKLEKEATCM